MTEGVVEALKKFPLKLFSPEVLELYAETNALCLLAFLSNDIIDSLGSIILCCALSLFILRCLSASLLFYLLDASRTQLPSPAMITKKTSLAFAKCPGQGSVCVHISPG